MCVRSFYCDIDDRGLNRPVYFWLTADAQTQDKKKEINKKDLLLCQNFARMHLADAFIWINVDCDDDVNLNPY